MRLLLLLLANIGISYAALGAMTIDFGTQFLKIGIVKPGIPMDIALNTESRRKTPNVVMLQDGHRTFADAAIGLQIRYPHLVFGNLNDLIGKNKDHPSFKHFAERNTLYNLADAPRNESGISFQIGDSSYSVEMLSAMIFANAKKFTEEHAQSQINDVVITVPVYFTPSERLAVERAAEMAGLNVLQLINDGTAAALSHGIFRRKEITEKAQRLMVYDMGAAKTTATLVEFVLVKEKYEKVPKMTVLGVGYDRRLGGIEMTNRLKNHIIDLFEKTYKPKTPVRENRRAMAKFAKEAERLKQVLSANAEHFAQIESAHEDIDAKLRVTRDDFVGLISDLEDRIGEPIQQALRMAQMPIEDVDQFVLMGAGTRVPKVQEVIQKVLGSKDIGKFLNTDEAIAMGSLFQAAHLSKGFKVKPFNVEEKVIFPIEVHFVSKTTDEKTSEVQVKNVVKTLFAANSVYPSGVKSISLTSYNDDFSIALKYGKIDGSLSKTQLNEFGTLLDNLVDLQINGLSDALKNRSEEETEFKGVKVSFQLDASGIVRVKKAEATIEDKAGIVGAITDTLSGLFTTKTEEGEPTETAGKSEEESEEETAKVEEPEAVVVNATQANVTETSDSGNSTVNGTEPVLKKKKGPSVIRLRVSATWPSAFVPNKFDVEDAKERLEKFAELERLAAARAQAENELESFNFEASLYLEEEDFVKYAAEEEEKNKLTTEIARIRSWLEDDVTKDTPTKEFTDNLLILKNIVRSVKKRAETAKQLPSKMKDLEQLLETSYSLTKMGENVDESKALFNKTDREALAKKLDKLKVWVNEKKEHLEKKKDFEDFDFTVKDVTSKTNALNREVDRFMKKMKKITTLDDLSKDGKIDIDELVMEAEKKKDEEEKKKKEKTSEESTSTPPPTTEEPKKTEL
ncbi:unnamed protein product [Caenorhabditis angaria]|uniref:EF-hand domain-containing protein n=1 Tax=Caenorhabditis angaria TaxID=860376 RepID=A0A9P1IAH4_9PELO|nr:unnamed protein product [Caenorhabditis angaria]